MDAVLAPLALRRRFRKRPWGYATRDVDAYVDDVIATNTKIRDELERLRVNSDPITHLSRDIAGVLQTLADSVAEARTKAEADADRVRADAEAQVAATLDEATTRFAAVHQHRVSAADAVARALDALQQAMIALAEVPSLPTSLTAGDLVSID